jgi:hypothetical protein
MDIVKRGQMPFRQLDTTRTSLILLQVWQYALIIKDFRIVSL